MSEGDVKPQNPVVAEAHQVDTFHVPKAFFDKHPHSKPHLANLEEYQKLYKESITEPKQFWGRLARELLTWERDFQTVHAGSFEHGDNAWFVEGKLNASFNCVDRHAFKNPDKPAIIYEADDAGDGRIITYGELLREVSKLAYTLKEMGVKKGDAVALYLPMIPEAVISFLACSRIGAIHSVIFAGFSSDSLRDRIIDAECKVIITTDEGKRGGKVIATKKIVDEALKQCPGISHCLVYKRTGAEIPWTKGRDWWWHEEVEKYPNYIAPESMSSEDPLFLLYTSGSTGKPKGVMHTTAGYLLGAAATGKYVFDIHDGDTFFCGGDVGWITGHTYVVYAPLLLGVATVVFEGTPAYPNFSRYWDIVDKYNVSQFYVAPTALRLLKRAGDEHVKHQMKHLRVLGSVGEPIAAEVWKWYFETVGKEEAHVVDTYWQTETGSHVITPLGGVTPTKPGSASLPFFGIEPAIIDPVSGEEIHGNDVEGVLAFKQPWPSMARTVWGAHKRYMDTYLNVYKGYYFTGDGAGRDHEGYYWIRGRVDDVVNVSGHRLSTAEIEAALIEHHSVAEAAVVGINDELTGQAVNAFVALKDSNDSSDQIKKDLILQVRKSIGPFAAPKAIFVVPDLPKTRSGKIMRRIMRKILAGEEDQLGDITTLSDPSVVDKIIDIVHQGLTLQRMHILSAFTSVLALATSAVASSSHRLPLRAIQFAENADILTPNHRVTAVSTFDIAFDVGAQRIRLSLEPNHDIFVDGGRITHLAADGTVAREEAIDRMQHKVFKGTASVKRGSRWDSVGWARVGIRQDGLEPLFEGTFTLNHDHHHIKLARNYRATRLIEDPEVDDDEERMVVFKDSDMGMAAQEDHAELRKRAGVTGQACESDSLGFNTHADHPVYAGMRARDMTSRASIPIERLFGRQVDGQMGSGGAGVNLVSTIGNTQGCPTTRKVALVGVAADCTYIQSFNRDKNQTQQNIIEQINSASELFESTFQISLGLANVIVADPDCPASEQQSTPWNQACSDSVQIQDRLNLFSKWRGQQNDNYSHWTLLSTCNTGSAVGLAWLGQACVKGSQQNSGSNSETVAGANVVIKTSTEWQVIAHETGHTYGAVHDCTSQSCADANTVNSQQCCPLSSGKCDAGAQYIMNPSTAQGITKFSPCSIGNICSALQRNSVESNCLTNNRGITTIGEPVCGNGIVEAGEDCDCGGSSQCGNNACCDPTTCKFKNNAGRCDGTVGTEIKSWIDEHLTLVIGLAAGIGGALVLCILCCCWRSYRRRRSRAKYAATAAAMPNGRRRGQPPMGQNPAFNRGYPQGQPPMQQYGGGQQQWAYSGGNGQGQGQQGWQGNAGVPMPPPLQHRSSVRYA
ncbi:Acetyl-coenzyme A synthetase 2-like, mitochondrial [Curvularia kusanoi]|uniref:Acetyl-coenzyme A synthetase n=1 Tax=Curvularia kusanoi TaxID=90978 RepID=A0A9P4T4W2_CURKU|nr:Acetyl-coenzyme A synthetase 2-like, mitochondrial [Curvularia kusanoi]